MNTPARQVPALLRLARRARCRPLVAAIEAELRTYKYYFKSTRANEDVPRRYGAMLRTV